MSYPSEAVRAVFERTIGAPIFQEQVMQLAVVAAGFAVGEAGQLHRAMAAWWRTGNLGPFERKLVGACTRGYPTEFAKQFYRQIKGFGEYGFPESHSASFALLAYASKCHEPAAFLCALLNSQPMGFYAPAQLIQDARRHGVEVRPVDVNRSFEECTLEPAAEHLPAVRLGFNQVSGLAEKAVKAIASARREKSFCDVPDLARRARLGRAELRSLASASALATLAGNRHQSYWTALGIEEPRALGVTSMPEAEPLLAVPTEGENLVADYASLGFTLGRHPLALLRGQLERRRVVPAEVLASLPNKAPVRVAGLVTHRQRPESANGVTFVTLEDETGHINTIVWPKLGEHQRKTLISARLLGMVGKLC